MEIKLFSTYSHDKFNVCTHADMKYFGRYLDENGVMEPPIIYMCPSVSKYCGFTLWQLANSENIVLQTVPQNIFNYLRTSNMGIFEKLLPAYRLLRSKE